MTRRRRGRFWPLSQCGSRCNVGESWPPGVGVVAACAAKVIQGGQSTCAGDIRGARPSACDRPPKQCARTASSALALRLLGLTGRMDRCWLQRTDGDALHAVLCAAGFNVRWLLRAIARRGLKAAFLRLLAMVAWTRALLTAQHATRNTRRAECRGPAAAVSVSVTLARMNFAGNSPRIRAFSNVELLPQCPPRLQTGNAGRHGISQGRLLRGN